MRHILRKGRRKLSPPPVAIGVRARFALLHKLTPSLQGNEPGALLASDGGLGNPR